MTTISLGAKDSINKALADAPEGPVTIILSKGTWNEKVFINRPDVTILSEEGAVISYGDRHGDIILNGHALNTEESATLTVSAPNFAAMGITIENSFPWPEGRKWNDEHDESEKKDLQAVAVAIVFGAVRSSFRSCTFKGWQDTLYVDYGLSSFEDSTIEGAVDYIFGAGEALFQGCEIVSKARGFVAAPSTFSDDKIGFVFHDCSFKSQDDVASESVYLARPWHPAGSVNRNPMALFIDCEISRHINPALWTDMSSAKPGEEKTVHLGEDARFYISSEEVQNIKGEEADKMLSSLISSL